MSQPYVGEIRMVGFNFAPIGWAFCDGAAQSIDQNNALYNLIGTTYGGDGQTTFDLPNLLGRVPIHMSPNYQIGQISGVENVTVLTNQLPSHSHVLEASGASATSDSPAGAVLATTTNNVYNPPATVVASSSVTT